MRNSGSIWVFAAILLLIDVYVFQAVKTVSMQTAHKTKWLIHGFFWLVSIVTILVLVTFPYVQALQASKFYRNYVFAILAGIFIAKLIAVLFFMVDDVRRIMQWMVTKIWPNSVAQLTNTDGGISRSTFLSWLGLGTGTTLFGALLFGFGNKYNYRLKKIPMGFANLPKAFKGFKIIHISDIHSGSLNDIAAVQKGIDLINAQQPDLIVFTGDLVNDKHTEMLDYIEVFNKLKAPNGVFSVLGNHDYGDYVAWPTPAAKQENLQKLQQIHAQMGWRLLMNEHVAIEKNGAAFALLGIENWGAKGRFKKYGQMEKAYTGTENFLFKILLSHDPSHWDAQVRTTYKDIDLMLAGHTHGMQFGLENPYFKWSPVQWMYKQWAGLYQSDNQKLYVNRGFGFIGYPGRVGIMPEITLIELVDC